MFLQVSKCPLTRMMECVKQRENSAKMTAHVATT